MKKLLFAIVLIFTVGISFANNILVQNVTTTGNNATNKTIQVQFDLSWDNSWRDAINWDAAWVFMKFKDASGVWQHAQLNTTGFANGNGTANTMQVTSDKVGCWVYRSAQGSGTFNSTTMQLQWNYGLSGLTSVAGLEVRVYAVEIVYIPQGDFTCPRPNPAAGGGGFLIEGTEATAQGFSYLIVNNRLSPSFSGPSSLPQRINGNVGIDTDNNGIIDNTTFPTGYKPFFIFKYEVTEQQYADFLNTLSIQQINTLGTPQQWNSSISFNNGQYFSSNPYNRFVDDSNFQQIFFSYADWSGLRPMSELECYKANFGPISPSYFLSWVGYCYYPSNIHYVLQSDNVSNTKYIATYYGVNDSNFDYSNNTNLSSDDPMVMFYNQTFSSVNGNGSILSSGLHDVSNWNNIDVGTYNFNNLTGSYSGRRSFRYVRSAE